MHRKLVAALSCVLAGKIAGVDFLLSLWREIAPVVAEHGGIILGRLSEASANDIFYAAALTAFAYTRERKKGTPPDDSIRQAVREVLDEDLVLGGSRRNQAPLGSGPLDLQSKHSK